MANAAAGTSASAIPPSAVAEEEAAAKATSDAPAVEHSRTYITTATFLSAGLGNSISACCTNPFDIIKVRQQLLTKRGTSGASFLSIGAGMLRNEGFRSFFFGLTASCLRESTYSTLRMGLYEPLKSFYATNAGWSEDAFGNKLLSGITSGIIGASFSTPTDLLKIRMQAPRPEGGRPPYPTTFHGFSHIYRTEGGLKALWRGVYPNTIRAAVLTSSQIATYDQVKGWFKRQLGFQEGLRLHFSASMVAGFVCSAASQPIDTIKVRLMTSKRSASAVPGAAAAAQVSSLSLVGSLLKNEGIFALWKGFGMCWARLGSHTVISLVLFEGLRGAFGIKPL